MKNLLLIIIFLNLSFARANQDSIRCEVGSGENVGESFTITMLTPLVFKLQTSVINQELFLVATELDGEKVKLYFELENEKQKMIMFPSREMTMDDKEFAAVFKLVDEPFKDYFNVTCYR